MCVDWMLSTLLPHSDLDLTQEPNSNHSRVLISPLYVYFTLYDTFSRFCCDFSNRIHKRSINIFSTNPTVCDSWRLVTKAGYRFNGSLPTICFNDSIYHKQHTWRSMMDHTVNLTHWEVSGASGGSKTNNLSSTGGDQWLVNTKLGY